MSANPCFNCTDRKVGCHSNCKDYKDFKDEREEKKNTIFKNKKEDSAFFSYHKKRGRK